MYMLLVILLLFFLLGNSFVVLSTVKSVEFFITRGVEYCDDFSSGFMNSRYDFFYELLRTW